MSKRVKAGWLWAYQDMLLNMQGMVAFDVSEPHPVSTSARLWFAEDAEGQVPIVLFRHEHGVAPRKNEAMLIDTTRREWWCPKCKKWFVACWHRVDPLCTIMAKQGVKDIPTHSCTECDTEITKSRCVVVERKPLKEKK